MAACGLPPAAHLPGTGWRGAAGRVKGEGSVCLVQILSTRASDAGRVEVGRRVSDALSPAPSPSLYRGEAEALGGRPTLELAERLDAGSRLPTPAQEGPLGLLLPPVPDGGS